MSDPRVKTNPRPEARRQTPQLVHDADPLVDVAALELLKVWALPQPADQRQYDLAVVEARRRLSAGGRPHRSNEPGVRAPSYVGEAVTNAGHDDDPILAQVRQEFASDYADFSRSSALCHLRAEAVLAASRRPRTPENYWKCMHAVADDAGRREPVDDDELGRHLEAAEALADLASARLAERGLHERSDNYEAAFIAEISEIGKTFGLEYRDRT
jgi:hypothetical protein